MNTHYPKAFEMRRFIRWTKRKYKRYPEFVELATSYENKLEEMKKQNLNDTFTDWFSQLGSLDDQIYNHLITFGDPYGIESHYGYYWINWNVASLAKQIQEKKIKSTKVPVDLLSHGIDQKEINQDNLASAYQNNEPVIAVKFTPFQRANVENGLILVDGNHRVYSRMVSRNTDEKINVYLLEDKVHMYALLSQVDRVLYQIHSHLVNITSSIYELEKDRKHSRDEIRDILFKENIYQLQ